MTIRHLNQIELAARWNISYRTLERWRWTGEGPRFVKLGGREEIDAALRRAKLSSDWLDGALALKYGNRPHAARQVLGKDTGAIRIEDGQVAVIADLPKRVDWKQKKLTALVERIRAEGDDPSDYVEIAIETPSAKFSAWPGPIRAAFEEARSLRAGKPSFRLAAATGGK